MIFYFSGTGNSQWVAEQLAERTNDKAFLIPKMMKELEEDINVHAQETIGIVFPIHSWNVPEVVLKFLQHVHLDPKSYAYAVATCSNEAGHAFDVLKQSFAFKSAWTVFMPEVYTPMFDLDPHELMREKLNVAQQRLPKIAADIMSKSIVSDVEIGSTPGLKTSLFGAAFSVNTKKFKVEESCNGCGECVKNCPMECIKLVDSKPVFGDKCQLCMSCIMRCPLYAIQYGKGTKKRGHYVNPFASKTGGEDIKTFYAIHPDNSLAGKSLEDIKENSYRHVEIPEKSLVLEKKEESEKESAIYSDKENKEKTKNIFFEDAEKLVDAKGIFEETQKILGEKIEAKSQLQNAFLNEAKSMGEAKKTSPVKIVTSEQTGLLKGNGWFVRALMTDIVNGEEKVTVSEVHLGLDACIENFNNADSAEFWYVLRGSGEVTVLDGESPLTYCLKCGDTIEIKKNVMRSVKNTGMEEFIFVRG